MYKKERDDYYCDCFRVGYKSIKSRIVFRVVTRAGGGRRALPYKRLMGMCRWIGLHFHDWIDYSGVAFSKEVLEWGRTFSDFWGKRVVHIYG